MGSVGGITADTLDGDKMYAATGLGYDDPNWAGITARREWAFARVFALKPGPVCLSGTCSSARCRTRTARKRGLRFLIATFAMFRLRLIFRSSAKTFRHHPSRSPVKVTTRQIAGHGDLNKQLDQVVPILAGPGVSQFRVPFDIPNARDGTWIHLALPVAGQAAE